MTEEAQTNETADFTQSDEFKAAVDAAAKAAIEPIKANADKILQEKRELQAKIKEFDGFDIEAFKQMQKKMEDQEDKELLSEGKLEELLNKRTERMRQDFEAQVNGQRTSYENVSKENSTLREELANERINNRLRREAETAGVLPNAIDDVLSRGRQIFSLSEDGQVVARSGDGTLLLSKDGQNVLGLGEFVESLKESAPHYWPSSTGAGLTGSGRQRGVSASEGDLSAAISTAGGLSEYRRLRNEQKKARSGR